ncbi:MAG: TolC family protein [Betaproteobacteria bacterium]|nr:TolC family protein [Betaproteobacteria bacterium]
MLLGAASHNGFITIADCVRLPTPSLRSPLRHWRCSRQPALLGWAADAAALDLAGALAQAWQLHPQAAGLDARDAEARAALDLANGLTPQPAAATLGHLNDRLNRNMGRREWELELAVPLWLRGQLGARQDEAQSRIQLAAAQRAAVKLALAGSLREAWWTLASVRAGLALATRKLDTARALQADVLKRYRVGELSRIDANLAQNEVLASEAEWADVSSAVLLAEQAYATLTGQSPPATLPEEAPATAAATPDQHPQLLASTATARTAQARVRLTSTTNRAAPELAVRVLRERTDLTERYGNQVGVRLTVPFAVGAQIQRDTSAALAESLEAEAELQRTQTRLEQDLARARQQLNTSERQLALSQQRVALASDNLALIEKAFFAGRI